VFECVPCGLWDLSRGGAGTKADGTMLADCAALEAAALEMGTTDSYRWGIEQVVKWGAAEHGLRREQVLPPRRGVPMAPRHLGAFLKWGATRWTVGTLRIVQASIAHWHRDNRAANYLETHEGDLWKRGAAKLAARREGARGVRRAPGLPIAVFRSLLQWLREQETAHPHFAERYRRDAAWTVLGFCGLLRRAELGALRVQDIVVTSTGVRIYIHKSKNSQLVGVWIDLPAITTSGTAIKDIVQRWLDTRHSLSGGHAAPTAPLFTAWRRGGPAPARGRMTAEALAPAAKGQALVDMFKIYLKAMVADGTLGADAALLYTGHSLRRGGATALYNAGWTAEEIIAHGRWTSEAYRIYLERTEVQRQDIVRRL
jgi:integrase